MRLHLFPVNKQALPRPTRRNVLNTLASKERKKKKERKSKVILMVVVLCKGTRSHYALHHRCTLVGDSPG